MLDVTPYLHIGSGQSSGSFFTGIGDRYAELGAASVTELGSSAPYYPILVGGGGVEFSVSHGVFLLWKTPFSMVAGIDVGAWGGAISGSTTSGAAFASTRAWAFALSIRADERYRFALGKGLFSIEIGPFVAVNCAYLVQESISAVNASALLWPALADLGFAGAGLGFDYGFSLGPGLLRLGLRGDVALTPLSSSDGALGSMIVYPWRALLRVGYELPLGIRRGKK